MTYFGPTERAPPVPNCINKTTIIIITSSDDYTQDEHDVLASRTVIPYGITSARSSGETAWVWREAFTTTGIEPGFICAALYHQPRN